MESRIVSWIQLRTVTTDENSTGRISHIRPSGDSPRTPGPCSGSRISANCYSKSVLISVVLISSEIEFDSLFTTARSGHEFAS